MSDSREEWKRKQEEAEREEEDEIDENEYKAQKDALLFVINVSESMLSKPASSDSRRSEKDSPLTAALKCTYQIMQQRIISNPKDMMGILLFGTEKSKFQEADEDGRTGLAYPHCYLLTDLDVPAASDVKVLKSIVEDEDYESDLMAATSEEVSMANVLFCANQIFTTKAPNFGSRRLFIITDCDEPHFEDKAMRSAAAVRAKDLYDLGVMIELFPISQPGKEFDRTKFYDDIVYRDPNDPDAPNVNAIVIKSSADADGISLLQSLIANINSKQVAKRALFSNLPFEIGSGLSISVKGYNILMPQKPARTCYVWLDAERPQIAVGETVQTDEATTVPVQKSELKKAYKFGGEQILFSLDEQKKLKDFGPTGLRIVGFKPQALLPQWASINKSTFIYPSEEDYVGSTRVFAALWQKLLKDQKVGITWYVPRVNANPEIVALVPSAERLDEYTGQQTIPAGLWVCPLPFADDIRQPPESFAPLVSPDVLVDQMRVVVQQLQLPGARYDPSKYPNPSLQWHYRILQAIALEEEVPAFKDGDDKTIPRYRQIDKRTGPSAIEWGTTLDEQVRAWMKEQGDRLNPMSGIKHERDDVDSKGNDAKKAKTSTAAKKSNGHGSLSAMSTSDLKKLVRNDKLGLSTVAELKEWLSSNGHPTTGNKPTLLARIEEVVEGM